MLTERQAKELRNRLPGTYDPLPRVFQAVADPGRWQMFQLLIDQRDLCVTDIAHILKVSVPAASQQLRIMESSGLVRKERRGQKACYQINRSHDLAKLFVRIARTLQPSKLAHS